MKLADRPLRIVLAASEAVPFSKTGGLADVTGALARSLDQLGHDVTVIVPDYIQLRQNSTRLPPIAESGLLITIPMPDRNLTASINWTLLPGTNVRVLLVRQPEYFDRPSPYQENGRGYADNCARFCFFSRVVMEVSRQMLLRPDIIHCNDWQTGIIPALLNTQYARVPGFEHTASVMTLHNMAFQGRFWHFDTPLTGIDWKYFNMHHLEAWGDLNLLKAGIAFADQVTTVSPTYADEICEADGGYGLEGILRHRRPDLVGILNGIDTDEWNPETDQFLPARYSAQAVDPGKACCKAHLQARMQLPQRTDVPLLGMVSRMSDQKGFDLIVGAAERLLRQDLQLAFLGTGDPHYEHLVRDLSRRFPDKVAAEIGFDESLAHQIEGGADIFMMPSRFEPCGLNQMYSLRYGTVPIVRKVGGLADSVIDYDPHAPALDTANGFVFSDYTPERFASTVERAIETRKSGDVWRRLMSNGMNIDWSWSRSAQKYVDVYRTALARVKNRDAAGRS
jgi:starch synthase